MTTNLKLSSLNRISLLGNVNKWIFFQYKLKFGISIFSFLFKMIILHFYYLFANLPPHFIYDLGHDFTHPCNKNIQNLEQDQQFTFLFGRLARASLEWVKSHPWFFMKIKLNSQFLRNIMIMMLMIYTHGSKEKLKFAPIVLNPLRYPWIDST